MAHSDVPSRTWTFFNNDWHDGNVGLFGPRTHAAWLGSNVFDGARAFEGATPDIEKHCTRINNSAVTMGLKPTVTVDTWLGLVRDGVKKFGANPELYIRPMYWAEHGGALAVPADPESTRWCLTMYVTPMPAPSGSSITLSPFRRPTIDTMPVDAKAACLYPNNGRALVEAGRRGFDNCLLRDQLGNVAELATANIFMAKGGVVYTPIANGTFLAGITRARVIGLLRDAGVRVEESVLTYSAFEQADEIWSCGNYSKVSPITRIDSRSLAVGPLFRKARELYWQFAHG
ncbi:MAG TPA: branched-chain amino acid aminotransferase [Steroidobacteraceae bacterium]|nr:branched-chain amino acid aminotransferase [Steroidobacteraceae bacterium]